MYTNGYILRTSADFDNAVYFQKLVAVWQNGEILNYGETIQSHTDHSVAFRDGKYIKALCEFKIR